MDSRFVQANERTLLAWIRTSLAMMTFGFVVARLGSWLNDIRDSGREAHTSFGTALGAAFVVLAVLVDVLAVVRYRRTSDALRAGREAAQDRLPFLFGGAVIVLGVLVVIQMIMALR